MASYERMLNISTNISQSLGEMLDESPREYNETAVLVEELVLAWKRLDLHICDVLNKNGYKYSGEETDGNL